MVKLTDMKKGKDCVQKPVAPSLAPSAAFGAKSVPEPIAVIAPAADAKQAPGAVSTSALQPISLGDVEILQEGGSGPMTIPDTPAPMGSFSGQTIQEKPVHADEPPPVSDEIIARLEARLRNPDASAHTPVQPSIGLDETVAVGSAQPSKSPVKAETKQPVPVPVAVKPVAPHTGGNAKIPERKWLRPVIISTAIVGALLFLYKECGHKEVPPAPKPVCVDPIPKTCTEQTGQPFGIGFNEACGYCGRIDPEGHYIRESWMTPDNCPVAFLCGNGRVDVDMDYASYVKDPKTGDYILGVTTVTESCKKGEPNYCPQDCPTPKPRHAKPAATVKPVHESAVDCKTDDPTRAQEAVGPIRNNILDARGQIDKKYPQFAGVEIKVNYRGRVDANGDVSLSSASVQGKDIRDLVDMGSVKVTTGKRDCEFIHTTAIPVSK